MGPLKSISGEPEKVRLTFVSCAADVRALKVIGGSTQADVMLEMFIPRQIFLFIGLSSVLLSKGLCTQSLKVVNASSAESLHQLCASVMTLYKQP